MLILNAEHEKQACDNQLLVLLILNKRWCDAGADTSLSLAYFEHNSISYSYNLNLLVLLILNFSTPAMLAAIPLSLAYFERATTPAPRRLFVLLVLLILNL